MEDKKYEYPDLGKPEAWGEVRVLKNFVALRLNELFSQVLELQTKVLRFPEEGVTKKEGE